MELKLNMSICKGEKVITIFFLILSLLFFFSHQTYQIHYVQNLLQSLREKKNVIRLNKITCRLDNHYIKLKHKNYISYFI